MDTTAALDDLRRRRQEVCAQQQTVEAQTRSREQVRAEVIERSKAAEAAGRATIASGLLASASGTRTTSPADVWVRFERVDLGPLLAAMMGAEAFAASMLQGIDDVPEGLAPPARAARLAELAAEREAIERAEEDEIVRLEAAGLRVTRRADADPRIVLAVRH